MHKKVMKIKFIGLTYIAKPFLDKESVLALYYSHIHAYLNYYNLAWGTLYGTNLKKLHCQQKHLLRTVLRNSKFEHTKLD